MVFFLIGSAVFIFLVFAILSIMNSTGYDNLKDENHPLYKKYQFVFDTNRANYGLVKTTVDYLEPKLLEGEVIVEAYYTHSSTSHWDYLTVLTDKRIIQVEQSKNIKTPSIKFIPYAKLESVQTKGNTFKQIEVESKQVTIDIAFFHPDKHDAFYQYLVAMQLQ